MMCDLQEEQRRQLTEEKEFAELKARQRSLGNIRSVPCFTMQCWFSSSLGCCCWLGGHWTGVSWDRCVVLNTKLHSAQTRNLS